MFFSSLSLPAKCFIFVYLYGIFYILRAKIRGTKCFARLKMILKNYNIDRISGNVRIWYIRGRILRIILDFFFFSNIESRIISGGKEKLFNVSLSKVSLSKTDNTLYSKSKIIPHSIIHLWKLTLESNCREFYFQISLSMPRCYPLKFAKRIWILYVIFTFDI